MNDELKCAPGLWLVDAEDDFQTARVCTQTALDEQGRPIHLGKPALIAEIIGVSREERHHTATMMAAAKELYCQLDTMIQCMEMVNAELLQNEVNLDHIREAKAAMKKARGEK